MHTHYNSIIHITSISLIFTYVFYVEYILCIWWLHYWKSHIFNLFELSLLLRSCRQTTVHHQKKKSQVKILVRYVIKGRIFKWSVQKVIYNAQNDTFESAHDFEN